MLKVVTANRLRDGRVVFLAAGGRWTAAIDAALPAAEPDEAESLMAVAEAAVAACEIVAPYLIDVRREGEGLRPVQIREAIRAEGPSEGVGRRA